MKTLAILVAATLTLVAALPASADSSRGGHDTTKQLIDLIATVNGLAKVDADILSKNSKGASILDLDLDVNADKLRGSCGHDDRHRLTKPRWLPYNRRARVAPVRTLRDPTLPTAAGAAPR
ncbi:MAG: hypothetical protein ABL956_01090 [Hyphomonadaceae bacterium]